MRHKNSYDFIRFVAASAVVLTHAFAIAGVVQPHIGTINLGGAAVWAFFILSGYLIAASWQQYPRFNVFFAKRALRIFPGLIVAIFLTVLVCGFFYTTQTPTTFFKHPLTLSYLNNIFLINTQYALPGVFEHNLYAHAVNGSLWTLSYEFLMYIAVAVLGVTKLLKKVTIERLWAALFVLQAVVLLVGIKRFDFMIFYFQFNLLVTLSLMFFTGVLALKVLHKIPLKPLYGVVALLGFWGIVTLLPRGTELVAALLLSYSLFALGSSAKLSWFGRYGDFSYGIYIYHFPVLQMIATSTDLTGPYRLFAAAWPISILLGALSWWLVESHALKLKSKINLKRYPVAAQTDTIW